MSSICEVEPLGFDLCNLLVDILFRLATKEIVEKAHVFSDVNIN